MRCDECEGDMSYGLYCSRCGLEYRSRAKKSPFVLLGLPELFGLDDDLVNDCLNRALVELREEARGPPESRDSARWALQHLKADAARLRERPARADLLLELAGGPSPEQDGRLPDGVEREVHELMTELGNKPGWRRRREIEEQAQDRVHAIEELLAVELDLVDDDEEPVDAAFLSVLRRNINHLRAELALVHAARRH
jgi:hypothetical protein